MLNAIPIGGLYRLNEDELNGPADALEAYNCYLDTGGIKGRNGYRSVLGESTLIGSGSDAAQGLWRFRVSPDSARFVVVAGGNVRTVTDPTSDDASDGAIYNTASGVFGASARVSAAQLGDYLYITSDDNPPVWRRLKPDYSIETIAIYQPPTSHSVSFGSYAWSIYRTMVGLGQATVTATGCAWNTTATGLQSDWYAIVGTGGPTTNPVDGAVAKITFTTPIDASGCDWVAFGVSPPTSGSGNKHVYISISADDADYVKIGDVWDTPIVGGSPNLIWCSLTSHSVSEDLKKQIKYVRFEVDSINDGTDLRYAVMGHMFVRSRTQANPIEYYVDFYNTTNKWASPLSPKISVTVGVGTISLPTYTDQFMDRNSYTFTTTRADPLNTQSNKRIFTASALPNRDSIGAEITISGTTPALTGPDKIRLWKMTPNGIRLVRDVAYPGANQPYSIKDTGSLTTLANEAYTAQGSPPRVSCLASRAQRLIGGYLNRVYISSFTPTNMYEVGGARGTQPFPKFPDIAEYEGDGWSFDIAPGSDEIIRSIINGDSLYVLTNKAVYSMSNLEPNSSVYNVFQRGCVGPNAAIWAEQELFWASYDGVYACRNRSNIRELSEGIRKYWVESFGQSSVICLAYKHRKLYVFNGTKYLRYDFVTNTWTRGEIAHIVAALCSYMDSDEYIALFFSNRRLARWLESATSDLMFGATSGTQIADWVYSTGFFWVGASTTIKSVALDATDTVSLAAYKTRTSDAGRTVAFSPTGPGVEIRRPFPVDLAAYKWRFEFHGSNKTSLRRVMWEPSTDADRITS